MLNMNNECVICARDCRWIDIITKDYDILGYHVPYKVWLQMDKELKREREARIVKAIEINEALFAASDRQK